MQEKEKRKKKKEKKFWPFHYKTMAKGVQFLSLTYS
jgi:hypothetical protein